MTVCVFDFFFFLNIFGVGIPAYFSNHSLFLREHIFGGFNEFPSLMYLCTVIHQHSFLKSEMGIYVCAV